MSRPAGASKENSAPPQVALLAGVCAAAGGALLRHLQTRSRELQRELSQTRSELESKSSQLSEVLEELAATK